MKSRRNWIVRVVSLAMPICILSCLAIGEARTSGGEGPSGVRGTNTARTREVGLVVPHHSIPYRMWDLSLDVREQTDSLLTPALLVQEAISEDVILTYPVE